MKIFSHCTLLLLLVTFIISTNAKTAESIVKADVKQFIAEYTIFYKSSSVGKGVRQLERLSDDTFRYSYQTDLKWLFFSDMRYEESIVTLNNARVIPINYKFKREGTGKDKNYEWRYDLANNKATDIMKNIALSIEFPDNIQDSLSYHLQHRINLINNPTKKHFTYPVIKSSGKIKNYTYQYDGEETIELPYGLVKTIKIKMETPEKKRITYAWFAPQLNFLLVKLSQIESGSKQFEAQLNSVETFD